MAFEQRQKIDQSKQVVTTLSKKAQIERAQETSIAQELERLIDEAAYELDPQEVRCPRCGSLLGGSGPLGDWNTVYCPRCNAAKDDPVPEDAEQAEDRKGDDLSDSEDDDDRGPGIEQEPEDKFLQTRKTPDFDEYLSDFLEECGSTIDEVPIYLHLIKMLLERGDREDPPFTDEIFWETAQQFGKTQQDIQNLWSQRPFTVHDLDALLAEWLSEQAVSTQVQSVPGFSLEIRKVGTRYEPVIHDLYEGIRVSSVKPKPSGLTDNKPNISPATKLQFIKQRNDTLYKVLQGLIEKRKSFLDAESREEAEHILRTIPFEQVELQEQGISKETLSRHFASKSVMTPHGLFLLSELTSQRSLGSEEISVNALRDLVRAIILEGDRKGAFYSDLEVSKQLQESHGLSTVERNIRKIRQEHLMLPNSDVRRRLWILQHINEICAEGAAAGIDYTDPEIARLLKARHGIVKKAQEIRRIRAWGRLSPET